MLANKSAPWQITIPPYVRIGIVGLFVGILFFAFFFAEASTGPIHAPEPEEMGVAVPQLDTAILGKAVDATRRERLEIEAEPLQHLLEKALDVSPAAAMALGMPDRPIALADLRQQRDSYRGKWLWFKGILEDLTGPRDGHPVKDYGIYEATVRIGDNERAICAFSLPPHADCKRGGVVRVEGFLMKLRDTTYPTDITEAPMLVGRQLLRDYADWAPVTEFDPELLAEIDDEPYFPGAKLWHTVEEDQGTPLWHLAAFARDTDAQRTFEEWRKVQPLNATDVYRRLVDGEVARGTPMRILGSLVKRYALVAPPNPAGITHWTVAYVQCQDFAGHVIPIWVPKKILHPLRTDLEIRGHYYRWYGYEGLQGDKFRVPLFIAAELDIFDIKANETMRTLGIAIGIALLALIFVIGIAQWRAKRESERHARHMDDRRRKRRERDAAAPAPNS